MVVPVRESAEPIQLSRTVTHPTSSGWKKSLNLFAHVVARDLRPDEARGRRGGRGGRGGTGREVPTPAFGAVLRKSDPAGRRVEIHDVEAR